MLVDFSNVPFPLCDHALFLLLCKEIQNKRLVQVPDKEDVDDSNTALGLQGGDFPECITEWVFEETRDVIRVKVLELIERVKNGEF